MKNIIQRTYDEGNMVIELINLLQHEIQSDFIDCISDQMTSEETVSKDQLRGLYKIALSFTQFPAPLINCVFSLLRELPDDSLAVFTNEAEINVQIDFILKNANFNLEKVQSIISHYHKTFYFSSYDSLMIHELYQRLTGSKKKRFKAYRIVD